jgi:hypothetical protein
MPNARCGVKRLTSIARSVTQVAFADRGPDVELVDQSLAARQADAESLAEVQPSVNARARSGMPGPLSSKARRRPVVARCDHLPAHLAAAAVDDRVARQFARRRDHLGLVDERELELLRQLANHLGGS